MPVYFPLTYRLKSGPDFPGLLCVVHSAFLPTGLVYMVLAGAQYWYAVGTPGAFCKTDASASAC